MGIKFLMFLPKTSAAVNQLQNHPFSPGKVNANKLIKSHQNKGFSGPITSVVFEEARNVSKNSAFDAIEPTSPKISCIGQIKHHKKKISLPKHQPNNPYSSRKKNPSSSTNNIIFNRGKPEKEPEKLPDNDPPGLNQLKRFASRRRDTFAKFDRTATAAQVAQEESVLLDNRRYFSDEDKRDSGEGTNDEEVIIPFSAPIILSEVKPVAAVHLKLRKEINLWKRRTTPQPKPLQLNSW